MPLTDCPACGRRVSIAAEACPQCGHPMRPSAPAPAGPQCYACSASATTRCQSCGKLSCALHLQSIYVAYGQGGARELRCERCYSWAKAWQVFRVIMFLILLPFVLFIFYLVLFGPFPRH